MAQMAAGDVLVASSRHATPNPSPRTCRLPCSLAAQGEHLGQVRVPQVLLSVPLALEYDPSGQVVGARVDRKTRDRCEDLSGLPVGLQVIPDLLGGDRRCLLCHDLTHLSSGTIVHRRPSSL